MTRDEACALVVELTRELATTGSALDAEVARRVEAEADRDGFRLVAQVAIGHGHTLTATVEGLRRALAAIRRDERADARRRAA